jgi:hypothetical protein
VVARVGAVVARVGRVGHGRHRVTLPRAMGSSERREDDHARGEVTPSFQRARSREETSVGGICIVFVGYNDCYFQLRTRDDHALSMSHSLRGLNSPL